MKLFGTPPSHFTRKVRVILQELSLPFEFIVLDRLLETGEEKFAYNPLHQFPVMEDGGRRLIESDLICEYLLERYGRGNGAVSLFPGGDIFDHKQRLAIMNGAMASGVKLIRAKRSGISWEYPFFEQEKASLTASLQWLENDLGGKLRYGEQGIGLLDISLMSLAEWAVFREFAPSLEKYPSLSRFVEAHKNRPSFASTHPSRGAP